MCLKMCMDTTMIVALEIYILDKRLKAQFPRYWLYIERVAAFQLNKG